jgi:hypothetical protein
MAGTVRPGCDTGWGDGSRWTPRSRSRRMASAGRCGTCTLRARSLEVISDAAYRRAVMIMNKHYGRRSEPYPLERSELPTLLATACSVARESGINREQIAAEACLSLEDLDAIVGNPDPRPLVTV